MIRRFLCAIGRHEWYESWEPELTLSNIAVTRMHIRCAHCYKERGK